MTGRNESPGTPTPGAAAVGVVHDESEEEEPP